MPSATDDRFPIGTRFGNYELTAFLGEGGMGTVYAAVHLGLGKRVAIKTLRADLALDIDLRMRFLREGKAAAAVRHPNVVDVDDVGVSGDTPYLVMELLEGEDLGAQVARLGRLSVADTVDIIVPVLLAMAEAHRAGVVHRDLKPDNIFLARDYHGQQVPKVLDFGISKLREAQSMGLTGNNTMLGTPYYMSPEQAGSARDVDARSDLYSIGVILYHCVTGRVPFAGTSLVQVIGQILHAQPIPLRELWPDVPQAFEAIVLRTMAKDPNARHAEAVLLARELLPFANHRTQVSYGAILQPQGVQPDTLLQAEPQRSAPLTAAKTHTPLAHSVATPPETPANARRLWPTLLLVAAAAAGLLFALQSLRPATPATGAPPGAVLPTEIDRPAIRLEDLPPTASPTPTVIAPAAAVPARAPNERSSAPAPASAISAPVATATPDAGTTAASRSKPEATHATKRPSPGTSKKPAPAAASSRPAPSTPKPAAATNDDAIWNDRH